MRSSLFRTTLKMMIAGLLTVTVQAQQADALKMTVTQGLPAGPVKAKDNKKKNEPVPSSVIVEVRDNSGKIVPGARVEIDSPAAPYGQPILGWTDTEGHAFMDSVIPVGQEGKLPLVAKASFNGQLGTATFNNTTMAPPSPEIMGMFVFKKQNHKVRNALIIAGIVAAAALAVALSLTLTGGAAKVIGPTATSVSLSGVTVGGPQ